MSITGALSNALSGLTAASRAAEVISSNIANAATEGYGPRTLELGARAIGGRGGVSVLGVSRQVDQGLLSERRLADSLAAESETLTGFIDRLSGLVGLPSEPGGLGTLMSEFESSLIYAGSHPESAPALQAVVSRAAEVADRFNTITDGVQSIRAEVDGAIDAQVTRLNSLLEQVKSINSKMPGTTGQENAALQDVRDRAIDEISTIVPVRVVPRDFGAVALFTPHGAVLLDGQSAEVGFDRTPLIMPHMTQDSGDLAGLSLNNNPLSSDLSRMPLRGGSLGALFALRDETTVSLQAQLDGVARDLAERFQDPALDSSLAPGDAGLFTDAGAAVDGVNEVGLAGRLRLNALVDPAQGGASWRLRDGLGATAPGLSGNASLLNGMVDVLGQYDVPASGALSGVQRSAHGLIADLQSGLAAQGLEGDRRQSFAMAQLDALKGRELQGGVDTDAELQKLMLIEQSYSANARMMQTVDELIDALLRI